MKESKPSSTAFRVALRRAAHQFVDNPKVLDDPIALRIIGAESEARLRVQSGLRSAVARYLRAFIVVRSRYAEDKLKLAVERGARQYVVLGAGLDTFAYRNPYPESTLRVFEVDHPDTQAWKLSQLTAAGIAVPLTLSFAPVNFEKQTLSEGLQRAGFDSEKATFFSWLGVTPYLTREAIMSTFDFIAKTPPGGGVAFDYAVPRESLSWVRRIAFDALARRVAAAGEPFQTFFEPPELHTEFVRMGFRNIEDLGQDEMNARYFKDRADRLSVGGGMGHIMSAEV